MGLSSSNLLRGIVTGPAGISLLRVLIDSFALNSCRHKCLVFLFQSDNLPIALFKENLFAYRCNRYSRSFT